MTVAVVVSREWPEPRRLADVLARLREKHPKATVVVDRTAFARRAVDGHALDVEARDDYLDVADRVLVFGALVGPVLAARDAGRPTAVYPPDGGPPEVFDEALVYADAVRLLDAVEVTDEGTFQSVRSARERYRERAAASRSAGIPAGAGTALGIARNRGGRA